MSAGAWGALALALLAAGCGAAPLKSPIFGSPGAGRREPSLPAAPAGTIRDEAPMVLVPAGAFLRGAPAPTPRSPSGEPLGVPTPPEKDDAPARSIHLDAFYIDQAEVSNRAYARFLEAAGRRPPSWDPQDGQRAAPSGSPLGDLRREDWSRFSWEGRHPQPGTADLPVTLVTWFDAEAYCAWAGKRLPTEAEWEKAARGADGRRYPWGSAPPKGRANFGGAHPGPLPPGSFPGGASPYGAVDLAGNVAEWVADYHGPGYYREAPERNPRGPERGAARVVRGGGWRDGEDKLQAFRRWRVPPAQKHGGVGFRCARGAE